MELMKTEMRETSRSNPETELDELAVSIAEVVENAIGYILGDKWKATPILAYSEKDERAYPAAIILENISLTPANEELVPEFRYKIASMVLDHAVEMVRDVEKKHRK